MIDCANKKDSKRNKRVRKQSMEIPMGKFAYLSNKLSFLFMILDTIFGEKRPNKVSNFQDPGILPSRYGPNDYWSTLLKGGVKNSRD